MKKIVLTDVTLRDSVKDGESIFTFKERVEIAKVLDKLGTDVIALAPIFNVKADTMAMRTVAAVVKGSVLSIPVGYTIESLETAWNAVSTAVKPELCVAIPTSAVCLEYLCHKKPAKALELITELVAKAKTYTERVNFSAEDATRADFDFLCQAIKNALDAGASSVTVCDTAGTMLPGEFGEFVCALYKAVPELEKVNVGVQCSDGMSLASACAVSALSVGANGASVTVGSGISAPAISAISQIIRTSGDKMNVYTELKSTELQRSIKQLGLVSGFNASVNVSEEEKSSEPEMLALDAKDDITVVAGAVQKLGYDLNDEDMSRVYEAFTNVAKKKAVGQKELEAIIATTALQVPTTYKLESFVINSGNNITATAFISMEIDGESITGVSCGDGPIAAAFSAVDSIVGRKYELDDFQIQSVTEGSTAIGNALVKLRAGGRLYCGNGISTDIIGASIKAYVSAINKIAYEEKA